MDQGDKKKRVPKLHSRGYEKEKWEVLNSP